MISRNRNSSPESRPPPSPPAPPPVVAQPPIQNNLETTEVDFVSQLVSEAAAQLNVGQTAHFTLPPGTSIMPSSQVQMEEKKEEMVLAAEPPQPAFNTDHLSVTVSYKIVADQQQAGVPGLDIPPEVELPQQPVPLSSVTEVKDPKFSPVKLPPIPVNNREVDPFKDTKTVMNSAGDKFDIPSVVENGYNLDDMTCTICEKTFKNDKTLMGHMISHFGVGPKMAKCPICGLTLQKKSYARHLRLHGDVVPEKCKFCNKEFREKRSLDKHIKAVHSGPRPYTCQYCSERFVSVEEQRLHSQRHLNEYPHQCDICYMTFQKREALTNHAKTHAAERLYTCHVCEKTFTNEKMRDQHASKHEGMLPHKCEVCTMTFQSRSQLIRHATSHTRTAAAPAATVMVPIMLPVSQPAEAAPTADKINNFLESFSASLESDMFEEAFEPGAGRTAATTDPRDGGGDGSDSQLAGRARSSSPTTRPPRSLSSSTTQRCASPWTRFLGLWRTPQLKPRSLFNSEAGPRICRTTCWA